MENLTEAQKERLKRLLAIEDEKLDRLMKIADEDEKWEWLWATTRKFGAWVFAVTAALVAFRDDVRALLMWITGSGNG